MPGEGEQPEATEATNDGPSVEEKQCRICLDGLDAVQELGRLIKPCLCRGSISYVHVKCLERWRKSAPSQSAFFSCPQCHYKYRFARTRAVGVATNPVIIAAISTVLFVLLTYTSSFVTTYLMSLFQEPTVYYSYSSSLFYVSPFEVAHDLVRAALRIIQDEDILDVDFSSFRVPGTGDEFPEPAPPGFLKSIFLRFMLGLPLIGAGSIIHMLISLPFIGPVHWLARYRGNRRRNSNSRDITALIIVMLLAVGAARALYKVYQMTQNVTKRLLLRAEDAILEVN
ncbi:hypothetical protein BDZ89DRAFT_1059106 [Hymenopellis radicata]|nr:hypothetical protein BDZ89DRAFT_1059106 [Hymenopellis radicata]